jgi:hypothetical protein
MRRSAAAKSRLGDTSQKGRRVFRSGEDPKVELSQCAADARAIKSQASS